MKMIIALATLLTVSFTAEAQGVLLTSGQSVDYVFSSLSPAGPLADGSTELYEALVGWADGTFLSGSSVTLSLFETSTSETPFRTGEILGYTPPPPQPGDLTVSSNGEGFLGLAGVNDPAWQDLQGVVRLTVTSGSIEVTQLGCQTVVAGIIYGGSIAPVPEPGTSSLLALAFTLAIIARTRRTFNPSLEPSFTFPAPVTFNMSQLAHVDSY
jgi:hypothetical protein